MHNGTLAKLARLAIMANEKKIYSKYILYFINVNINNNNRRL